MSKEHLLKEREIAIRIVNFIHIYYLKTRLDDIHDLYIEALYNLWRIDDELELIEVDNLWVK